MGLSPFYVLLHRIFSSGVISLTELTSTGTGDLSLCNLLFLQQNTVSKVQFTWEKIKIINPWG